MSIENRGFGTMAKSDPDRHKALAKKGGQRAHVSGKAHVFTSDSAKAAAAKSVAVRRAKKEAA